MADAPILGGSKKLQLPIEWGLRFADGSSGLNVRPCFDHRGARDFDLLADVSVQVPIRWQDRRRLTLIRRCR